MKDDLGARMKSQYEVRTQTLLPRRTYTVIRLDGRAFHTYTRDIARPFDSKFMSDMQFTMVYLCHQIPGVKIGYVQSDEISLIITDFDNINTSMWFDGNVQKIVSVSAATATAAFNHVQSPISSHKELPVFDSRVFVIPDVIEVGNYLIWRQKDARRNAQQMVAQLYYSQKELQGKSLLDIRKMLFQNHHIDIDTTREDAMRGAIAVRVPHDYVESTDPGFEKTETRTRWEWMSTIAPDFTQDKTLFEDCLPGWPQPPADDSDEDVEAWRPS